MSETSTLAPIGPDRDQWAVPVVSDLGNPMFHAALLVGLRDTVGADHVTDLCYRGDGSLQYCSAASLLNQSLIEWTTNIYVNGLFYRRDPNYALFCDAAEHRHRHAGLIIETVSPGHIADSEYRRLLFEKPGFASKISIISVRGDCTSYINLYFSRVHAPGVTELMRGRAPLLLALAQRHQELSTAAAGPHASTGSWSSGLSLREIQVAELLRQGCTAKQVGRELGLSPATVVTYKNRIFKKSQVASLREFLVKVPPLQAGDPGEGRARCN